MAQRSRAEKSADRRLALVRLAYLEIARRGFEGLRTREVAAEAGVNIATLHYYFPTKEALIGGVVEYTMNQFRATLVPHTSSRDQLRSHFHAVRALLKNHPDVGIVMGELALRSARDPALARLMDQANEAWHRTLRGLLKRAVKDGSLRPEFDSDDVASLVMATMTSMTLPTVASGPRIDQALRELERWLGLRPPAEVRPARRRHVQATD
jgi:AcrR family transcriptional regulator